MTTLKPVSGSASDSAVCNGIRTLDLSREKEVGLNPDDDADALSYYNNPAIGEYR
jgi:hypothetical protein